MDLKTRPFDNVVIVTTSVLTASCSNLIRPIGSFQNFYSFLFFFSVLYFVFFPLLVSHRLSTVVVVLSFFPILFSIFSYGLENESGICDLFCFYIYGCLNVR